MFKVYSLALVNLWDLENHIISNQSENKKKIHIYLKLGSGTTMMSNFIPCINDLKTMTVFSTFARYSVSVFSFHVHHNDAMLGIKQYLIAHVTGC